VSLSRAKGSQPLSNTCSRGMPCRSPRNFDKSTRRLELNDGAECVANCKPQDGSPLAVLATHALTTKRGIGVQCNTMTARDMQ
jgi:hypothetical protein